MIPTEEIQRIKSQVAITDVLASRGIMPVFRTGDELLYCSPLRTDNKPSFSVNEKANVFNDLVIEEHRGDVIRLVMFLDAVGFATAVQTLQQFFEQPRQPSFFLSGPLPAFPGLTATSYSIRDVKLLSNPSLLRYVESRGISVGIARMYLREVHYVLNGRYRYAVGFRNDWDGFFLRNGVGCKQNIGPSYLTTIDGTYPDARAANIFEGVFDFLSALEFYGQSVPTFTTYVLNSVTNLSHIVSQLGRFDRINVFFDRDKAGRDAFESLKANNLPVVDQSALYRDEKDMNDFLLSTRRDSRAPDRSPTGFYP